MLWYLNWKHSMQIHLDVESILIFKNLHYQRFMKWEKDILSEKKWDESKEGKRDYKGKEGNEIEREIEEKIGKKKG